MNETRQSSPVQLGDIQLDLNAKYDSTQPKKKPNWLVRKLRMLKKLSYHSMVTSKAHGVDKIVNNKSSILKFMWLMFVLASLGCSMYLISVAVNKFLKYQVVTTIAEVAESPTPFFAVSICNTNFIVNNASLRYAKALLDTMPNISLVDNYDYLRYFFSSRLNTPSVSNQRKQSMGSSLDEFVISCRFNTQPCDMSLFSWYFDSYYGNCFRFNSGNNSQGQQVNILESTKGEHN